MPLEPRIDTQAHFLPPFYRDACRETGHGKPDGMPNRPVRPNLVNSQRLPYTHG